MKWSMSHDFKIICSLNFQENFFLKILIHNKKNFVFFTMTLRIITQIVIKIVTKKRLIIVFQKFVISQEKSV